MSAKRKIIAENRKARYDYQLDDFLEVGIVLTGTEVKSLRQGKCSLVDAFAQEIGGELFLLHMHIADYEKARVFKHDPRRARKLLLHRTQMNKLIGKIKIKGMTIVPVTIYFNEQNRVKVEIAVAKGKKEYDKRESEKKADWDREKARVLRGED